MLYTLGHNVSLWRGGSRLDLPRDWSLLYDPQGQYLSRCELRIAPALFEAPSPWSVFQLGRQGQPVSFRDGGAWHPIGSCEAISYTHPFFGGRVHEWAPQPCQRASSGTGTRVLLPGNCYIDQRGIHRP